MNRNQAFVGIPRREPAMVGAMKTSVTAALLALAPLLIWLSGCDATPETSIGTVASNCVSQPDARQAVKQILNADMSPEARMKALEPYVDVGLFREKIEEVLGWPQQLDGFGSFFMDATYGGLPGLRVAYNPDGKAYWIGYRTKDGRIICLRSDDRLKRLETPDAKDPERQEAK